MMPHYGLKHYDNKENEDQIRRRVHADPFLAFVETSTKKYDHGGYDYTEPFPHEIEKPLKDQISVPSFNLGGAGGGPGPDEGMDITTIQRLGAPTEYPAYDKDHEGNIRYPCKSWILTGPK
jgi:hypothetical protein